MPVVFGCVNGSGGTDRKLRTHVEETFGNPTYATFEDGCFAAIAHGGRKAAWLDTEGNAWAVFGERLLSSPVGDFEGTCAFRLDARRQLVLSPEVRGVVGVFDATLRRLTISCDWLNYFPVYYWHKHRTLLFGSHLKSLSLLTGATPDPAGIVEFLRSNWCLNGRTVFAGIRRILPGQAIEFDASTGDVRVTESSQLWAGVAADYAPPTNEEIWDRLLDAVRRSIQGGGVPGLMLSGGWDSRVLLAALAQVSADRLVTITHGSLGHRELDLAQRLAARVGARHVQLAFGPDAVGRPHDLDTLLETTNSLLFPWWRFAGGAFLDAGCNVAFSGVLGEVLGGHYTVVGRGRSYRAQEVFQRAVLRSTRHTLSAEDGLRRVLKKDYRSRSIPFLNKDASSVFAQDAMRGIADDIETVVHRYLRRGIGDAGRMVEAYNTEYRALDYVCQQPIALTGHVDVALPLGSRRLVEAVLAVPLTCRIQNSLSRNLLRTFRPELLELPLAASPFVPASAPILVQESGRVVRYVLDRFSKQVYLLSGGRIGAMRRYGWVDFESDVRAGDFLDVWRDSLTWDGLDRNAIDRYVAAIRSHQAPVRFARPILKLTYLDRMFRGGAGLLASNGLAPS